MIKKIVSVLLAVVLVVSVFAIASISFNAATYNGVELEANKLYFDVNGTGWELGSKDKVSFYVYSILTGEELIAWGGKKLQGTLVEGTLWSYDPAAKGMTLNDGEQYCILFVSPAGQTYDLLFDTTCLGHAAYCDGTEYENPVDSSQTALAAFWYGLDAKQYGPRLQISSTGNVVGTCIESGKTAMDIFTTFLTSDGATGLANARQYSDKTEQKMIDDIGVGLGLTADEIQAAFTSEGVETTWSYADSTLPKATPTEAPTEAPVPTEAPTDPPAPTVAPTDPPAPTQPPTIPVDPDDPARGDANNNGELDITDVTCIQRYIVKLIKEDAINLTNADADRDGIVDIIDATLIQRVLAGFCNWDKVPTNA